MHQDMVVGIDLGTTNSCVAVMIGEEVHVIPDEQGQRIQSSVIQRLGRSPLDNGKACNRLGYKDQAIKSKKT